jgi:hypothetical protein
LFVTGAVKSVKGSDRFAIFFVKLFIIKKDIKPFLLIRRALRHIIKRIV